MDDRIIRLEESVSKMSFEVIGLRSDIQAHIKISKILTSDIQEEQDRQQMTIYGNGQHGLLRQVDRLNGQAKLIRWAGSIIGGATLLGIVGLIANAMLN